MTFKKDKRWIGTIGLLFLVFYSLPSLADDSGLPIHGFADVGWGEATQGQPTREITRGFGLGNLDLYLTPQFSDHVKSLIEAVFEPGLDSQQYEIDLERIQMGYTFSDDFTLWLGRFHTPLGYWLTTYHHGAEIQTSVYKPRVIDWEDHAGFLPAHSVGLWGTGRIRLGAEDKLNYDVWIANGSRIIPTGTGNGAAVDFNGNLDDNTSLAAGARLGYAFGGSLKGLLVGVHGLHEEVDSYDSNNAIIAQNMLNIIGGFAVYEENDIEFSSEFYQFLNSNLQQPGSSTLNSTSWFAQLGYSILPDLIPYGRYESTTLNQNDSYFSTQQNGFSYTRTVLGLRYNLNSRSCIKLEGNHTNIADNTAFVNAGSYNEIRTQYAIRF